MDPPAASEYNLFSLRLFNTDLFIEFPYTDAELAKAGLSGEGESLSHSASQASSTVSATS